MNQTITLSREELDLLTKPCVYQMMADGGKVLYVGCSEQGYKRVFNWDNNQPDRTTAFKTCAFLFVTFFNSREEAAEIEKQKIHEHHPSHNWQCSMCFFYSNKAKQKATKKRKARKEPQ